MGEKLNLIVAETGGDAFLGDCEDSPEVAERILDEGGLITVLNALAIGKVGIQDARTGAQVAAPCLGTIHWCALEPVRKLKIIPKYHYWVDDQSPRVQEMYLEEYTGYLRAMETTAAQAESIIQTADPEALRKIEEVAMRAGIGRDSAVQAIIQDGLDRKLREGSLQ